MEIDSCILNFKCRLGILGYLESSIHGKGLYEKFGYKVVREIEFDPRPWGVSYTNVHFVRQARFLTSI
jgi:hypothetical protein